MDNKNDGFSSVPRRGRCALSRDLCTTQIGHSWRFPYNDSCVFLLFSCHAYFVIGCSVRWAPRYVGHICVSSLFLFWGGASKIITTATCTTLLQRIPACFIYKEFFCSFKVFCPTYLHLITSETAVAQTSIVLVMCFEVANIWLEKILLIL